MTKLFIRLALALLPCFLFSCGKEETAMQEAGAGSREILARYDPLSAEAGTKVTIDNSGVFAWQVGDRIAVHSDAGFYYPASFTSVDDGGNGHFSSYYAGQRNLFAVYPYYFALEEHPGGAEGLWLYLPSSYKVQNSGSTWQTVSSVPMVADNLESEALPLQFKHVGGLFRFTLSNVPSDTQFIKVTSAQNLAGNFSVDNPGSAAPSISFDNASAAGESNEVLFVLATKLSSEGTVVVNLPVPVGNCCNLQVSALNSSYSLLGIASLGEPKTVERGKLYNLTAALNNISTRLSSFSVPDFSLTNGKSVNLIYTAKKNKDASNATIGDGLTLSVTAEDPTIIQVDNLGETASAKQPAFKITGLQPGTTYLTVIARLGADAMYTKAKVTVSDIYTVDGIL
jgi:hypothetical protein